MDQANLENLIAEIIDRDGVRSGLLLKQYQEPGPLTVATVKAVAAKHGRKFTDDLFTIAYPAADQAFDFRYFMATPVAPEVAARTTESKKSNWDSLWEFLVSGAEIITAAESYNKPTDGGFYEYEMTATKPETIEKIWGLSKPVFYAGVIAALLFLLLFFLNKK